MGRLGHCHEASLQAQIRKVGGGASAGCVRCGPNCGASAKIQLLLESRASSLSTTGAACVRPCDTSSCIPFDISTSQRTVHISSPIDRFGRSTDVVSMTRIRLLRTLDGTSIHMWTDACDLFDRVLLQSAKQTYRPKDPPNCDKSYQM
jgi:Na+-translocating ferredoxin:NAD+ oxidoreductase RNF subunit RnfB